MSEELIHVLGQRPACTGSGMYLQACYREADRREYDQKVVAAAQQGSGRSDCEDFKDDFLPVEFMSEGLSFPIFGMSDNMPYRSRTYASMSAGEKELVLDAYLDRIEKAAADMDEPVILCHHLWLVTSAAARRFEEYRVIGISHGTGLRQLQKNPRFADEVREGVAHLDKIFALNRHQQRLIAEKLDYDRDEGVLTGLGYSPSSFFFPSEDELEKRRRRDGNEIAYVGKLSRSKGVHSLLRACDNLRRDDVKLTLIGSGQGRERDEIEKLADEVSCSVEMTGLLPQDEVGRRLRRADLFCLPSFYEGFALVLLEALACGLRVVSSDIPGVARYLPDIIEESGAVEFVELPPMKDVDVPDEEELAGYERRLSTSLSRQLEQTGDLNFLEDEKYRQVVKSLSWSGVFERLEQHFAE